MKAVGDVLGIALILGPEPTVFRFGHVSLQPCLDTCFVRTVICVSVRTRYRSNRGFATAAKPLPSGLLGKPFKSPPDGCRLATGGAELQPRAAVAGPSERGGGAEPNRRSARK